jgi:hypothetical protein
MKKLFAVFLLVTVLLGPFGKSLIYLHYEIYKSYYAQVLCVNKNKPMLHCNGHCQLKKELKEEEKRSSLPFSNIKYEKEILLYSQPTENYTVLLNTEGKLQHTSLYSEVVPQSHLMSVFRPPQV